MRATGLHVEYAGEGAALVWAHGLAARAAGDSWADWAALARTLKVVRYDARGHGNSAVPGDPHDYRWDRLGRDMLAVADGAGDARFIAGGVSMGCATAIHAAVQAPARIKALVLVLPPAAWEARAAQAAKYRRAAALGKSLGSRLVSQLAGKAIEDTLPRWFVDAEPGKAAAMSGRSGALDGNAWADRMLGAAASNLPPRDAFAALAHIPAAILAWEGDATHPLSSAEALHRLLPQSTLFVARDHASFTTIAGRIGAFARAHA